MSMDKLNEAILKAKSGDKSTAGRLLSDYIRENPSSDTAWLWLSVCLDPIEQKRFCLNKALAINPDNENARKALAQLDLPPPPEPSFEELSGNQPVALPGTLPKPEQSVLTPARIAANQELESSVISETKMPAFPMKKVGGYVQSILLPGEKVLATGKIHWIIFLGPVILIALGIIDSIIALQASASLSQASPPFGQASINSLISSLLCIPFWLIGLIGLVTAIFRYKTTEFALTDQRVIGKAEIIRRSSLELVLGKIESIRVNQNILGRILNFGTLVVTGSGGTHQIFPYISAPMEMKKTINTILAE